MIKNLRFRLCNECSQRWYRLSSWRACGVSFRKLSNRATGRMDGFAFGPVMFFWWWN